ncbi:DUF3168 domain-containing protein [Pseudodonghicola flavimaris]|uniref:DUF3168 domain-containing protein n=1 Tax=Pseudodonghicola flavimaris TaxID=3050036 RepID=A0ABT7EZE9_9RHOB|nr:DUF3168 domain-containing protein [Pseudodonghicola flavimaris]MDK3017624.1 hypothetical protein [Pseudodonghicola flavimaris]
MERDLKDLLKTMGHPVVWGAFGADVGYPRIALQRVSTVTRYSLKDRADIEGARVQVTVSAATYGEIITICRQLSQVMTDFRGGAVISCREISRRDSFSETGGDVIRQQMLDFWVRYRA